MILNFNITGNESMEDLGKKAMEAMNVFQEEIPHTPKGSHKSMHLYYMLGKVLVSFAHINMAMNESKGDVKLAKEICKRYCNDSDHEIRLTVDQLLDQVKDGRASLMEV